MVPKGLYSDKSVTSAKNELLLETDYIREANSQERFRDLLKDDNDFFIPKVIKVITK